MKITQLRPYAGEIFALACVVLILLVFFALPWGTTWPWIENMDTDNPTGWQVLNPSFDDYERELAEQQTDDAEQAQQPEEEEHPRSTEIFILVAAILAAFTSIAVLFSPEQSQTGALAIMAIGVWGSLYYIHYFFEASDPMSNLNIGFWLALIGMIGLVLQVFVPRVSHKGIPPKPLRLIFASYAGEMLMLCCLIALSIAFFFTTWRLEHPRQEALTGWEMIQLEVNAVQPGSDWLIFVPIALLLAAVMSIWSLTSPEWHIMPALFAFLGGVGALAYYSNFYYINRSFTANYDPVDLLQNGFWLGLAASIGLVVQLFIPRIEVNDPAAIAEEDVSKIDMAEPILVADNLTKHFMTGGALSRRLVKAVQEASFELHPGQVLALVGESGSGKSTIARMLARLYDPTEGAILYRGETILEDNSRYELIRYRGNVQMIFQDPFSSLNPAHKISHHLERALRIHGRNQENLHEQVLELLREVSLTPPEEFYNKYPHQLSGGQRQRVAIARALAVRPKVILADEPISMLDVSIRLGVLNLMEKLRTENNIAFLYITHDLASARYFAGQILVMYAGHIVERNTSENLIQEPKHPYTQLLLSAVPDPSRGLRTADVEIEGEIPDLSSLGEGCPFAPRCQHFMQKCDVAMPPITMFEDGSWTRCYLYEGQGVAEEEVQSDYVVARQIGD